jgi:hypothetical protein
MPGDSRRSTAAFVALRPVRSTASGKSALIARASAAVPASGGKYIVDRSSPMVAVPIGVREPG